MSRRDPFGTRQGSGAIHRTIYNSRVNSATTFYAFNLRVSAEIPLLGKYSVNHVIARSDSDEAISSFQRSERLPRSHVFNTGLFARNDRYGV